MTSAQNFYRNGPRKTREFIIDCLEAGLVPNVIGPPAIGKSSLFRSAAAEFNLKMIDHRVSTSSPVDFTGLPEFQVINGVRKATFSPFDIFPIESDPLPEGFDGWLLFLDEANSGTNMVQAAMYKLVLDNMTGQFNLHNRLRIGLAGNRIEDRAIVNKMGTAMQSRVVTIEMEVVYDEWLLDVALKQNYDERILAFLSYDNDALFDFKPDHNDKNFCSPRTWEFMNKHLTRGGKPKEFGYVVENGSEHFTMQDKLGLYAGTITSGVAAQFVAFCEIYRELTNIQAVLADPLTAPIPTESQRKWATVSHLINKITEANFADICVYINRFTDTTFKILFFRAVMVRYPKLRSHPDFAKAMITLSRYLRG